MSSMNFTEEPEEIEKGAASSAPAGAALQSKTALTPGPDDFGVRLDEHKWALEILNQYFPTISKRVDRSSKS